MGKALGLVQKPVRFVWAKKKRSCIQVDVFLRIILSSGVSMASEGARLNSCRYTVLFGDFFDGFLNFPVPTWPLSP